MLASEAFCKPENTQERVITLPCQVTSIHAFIRENSKARCMHFMKANASPSLKYVSICIPVVERRVITPCR